MSLSWIVKIVQQQEKKVKKTNPQIQIWMEEIHLHYLHHRHLHHHHCQLVYEQIIVQGVASILLIHDMIWMHQWQMVHYAEVQTTTEYRKQATQVSSNNENALQ